MFCWGHFIPLPSPFIAALTWRTKPFLLTALSCSHARSRQSHNLTRFMCVLLPKHGAFIYHCQALPLVCDILWTDLLITSALMRAQICPSTLTKVHFLEENWVLGKKCMQSNHFCSLETGVECWWAFTGQSPQNFWLLMYLVNSPKYLVHSYITATIYLWKLCMKHEKYSQNILCLFIEIFEQKKLK